MAASLGVAFEVAVLCGFRIIKPDEIALVSLFGQPKLQVGVGLLYAPFPLTVQRAKATAIEENYPTKKGESNELPISVTHGSSVAASADPLDNRITTSVRIVCRYKLIDLAAFNATVGSTEEARNQLRDILVTETQVECAKRPVGQNLAHLNELNAAILARAREATKSWGVDVISVGVQDIDLGGAINDALRSVPVSIINLEVNRNNAQKRYFEGLADAEVHKAFQYAKAEGYKTIARELNVPEAVVIYQIEMLANMWRKNNADVNLFAGDMGEVFRMITSFAKLSQSAPV
jgi:regulator of protease activity HflC (stomatin/prohibitin superfamily)